MGATENGSSLAHIASQFLSPPFLISAFPCEGACLKWLMLSPIYCGKNSKNLIVFSVSSSKYSSHNFYLILEMI